MGRVTKDAPKKGSKPEKGEVDSFERENPRRENAKERVYFISRCRCIVKRGKFKNSHRSNSEKTKKSRLIWSFFFPPRISSRERSDKESVTRLIPGIFRLPVFKIKISPWLFVKGRNKKVKSITDRGLYPITAPRLRLADGQVRAALFRVSLCWFTKPKEVWWLIDFAWKTKKVFVYSARIGDSKIIVSTGKWYVLIKIVPNIGK